MKILYLIFSLSFFTIFISCSFSAKIGDQAVNTPVDFRENKVLFVDSSSNKSEKRNLKFGYQLNNSDSLEIQKLEPIGCIIRGVRIPDIKKFKKPRDIAVILDIVTAGSNSLTSLVVFYQRNVTGGQMLNFQDILVYYEPEWDGVTPPYFRVRLMDVKAERNTRSEEILEKANDVIAGLTGVIPHPVLPGVQTTIEAAKLILRNQENKVILDYQVQFYSPAQITGSNTKLLPLRKGEWLVLGRQKDTKSQFWKNEFFVNQRTGEIVSDKDSIYAIPYVSLVLMSADAIIPKHIMDRSKILIETLESNSERNNLDGLNNSISNLYTSVTVYNLERRLKKYCTTEDFKSLANFLIDSDSTKNLSIDQSRRLYRLVNAFSGKDFYSSDSLRNWWIVELNCYGKMEEVKENELKNFIYGYKWVYQDQSKSSN